MAGFVNKITGQQNKAQVQDAHLRQPDVLRPLWHPFVRCLPPGDEMRRYFLFGRLRANENSGLGYADCMA